MTLPSSIFPSPVAATNERKFPSPSGFKVCAANHIIPNTVAVHTLAPLSQWLQRACGQQ